MMLTDCEELVIDTAAPFVGAGVSLYVSLGTTVQYRNQWFGCGGSLGAIPDVTKTARISKADSPADTITVPLDPDWIGETITIDIRTFRDNVENESDNYRTITIDVDGDGLGADAILGTATLLTQEQRDGGIVRLRFAWEPAANGVQPDTFTAIRTAGPTSPANASVQVDPGIRTIIEIDTPVLSDASNYTYKLQASLDAVTADVLTGITVAADATGPSAATGATAEAW